MNRCKSCRKLLWTKGQAVEVVRPRPADDAGSVMFLGGEELSISTLNALGSHVEAKDLRSGVVVCRGCWSEKLEPTQRSEVDRRIDAFRSATDETPLREMTPLGNATDEYYLSRLADLLDESTDRNVRGWILFAAANRIHNFSAEVDEMAKDILIPKVVQLYSDRDYDIARAAKLVIKAFAGGLEQGEWKVFNTPSWTGFKKLP